MRRKHEMVDGHPISVWDDGDKCFDRYTAVYLDTLDKRTDKVQYVGMSEHPTHPQGFGQHGEMPINAVQYEGRGGAFKKRIRFADLPADCQKLVRYDIAEMNKESKS